MTLALSLIVAGIVLTLLSFLYALWNMSSLLSKPGGWERGFKKHLGCLAGLAAGSLLTSVGVILAAENLNQISHLASQSNQRLTRTPFTLELVQVY